MKNDKALTVVINALGRSVEVDLAYNIERDKTIGQLGMVVRLMDFVAMAAYRAKVIGGSWIGQDVVAQIELAKELDELQALVVLVKQEQAAPVVAAAIKGDE